MFKDSYFYNRTIRKTVGVFGSLFNQLYTGKVISGQLTNAARVPLAYAPRERFLARIRNTTDDNIAIKLPRMSFEITSITFDGTTKLNRQNVRKFIDESDNGNRKAIQEGVPYILGLSLTIMSDGQDSALQILEQILPRFNPDHTVSVKDMEGPGSKTDVPFILTGVSLQDDYEGDFESGRRLVLYTLDFTTKVKFIGEVRDSKIIKNVTIQFIDGNPCDSEGTPLEQINIGLGDPENDTEEDHTIITTYGFD